MVKERDPNKRLWKVRIYPDRRQIVALDRILAVCCDLYNAALQERRDAYRLAKVSLTLAGQCRELTGVRAEFYNVAAIYQEIEANVLRRVDLAFRAFFRRCKAGETPGFPRYKAKRRYTSFEYPHGNRCVRADNEARTIALPSIGAMPFRDARGVPELFTVVKIIREARGWFACFETVIVPEVPLPSGREIGVDVGVANLAATSDGTIHANPRHADRYRRIVEGHQRRFARCKRGSRRRRAAIRVLARAKQREAAARLDTGHKVSRLLVQDADLIVFEDLQIGNMTRSAKGTVEEPGSDVAAKSGLNRAILDAGWRRLIALTTYKAAEAGRYVGVVNPANTSRTCSDCGHVAKENRRTQASFACVACGHTEHADINAAKNILARYRGRLGLAA